MAFSPVARATEITSSQQQALSVLSSVADSSLGALNSWTTKASYPSGGAGGAAVVNGTIYVISGSGNYFYNTATDNWTAFPSMPTPREGFAVAACDNKIYVIGGEELGFQFPLHYSSDISYSAANEVYDPSTNTWATKASMPIGTSSMQANTVNGKIYLIGGSIVTAGTPPYTWATPTVNFTEIYDPATDSWTKGAPMPYPVIGYASAIVDNKIYVIGGQDEYNLPEINVTFNQIYDPASNSWSFGAPIPVATFSAVAGATTGEQAPERIYVLGGSGGFGVGLNQNYVYDPVANNWTAATPMLTARYSPTAAVVDDVLYVIGGWQGLDILTTNEQYTPIGYVASPTPTSSQSDDSSTPLASQQPTQSSQPQLPSVPILSYVAIVIVLATVIVVAIIVLNKKRRKTTR
jgi:N-acetylneuraminic acid mutarotase